MKNSENSSKDTDLSIPLNLIDEWQSYLACCESLEVQPNARRFLRYNELYPYK